MSAISYTTAPPAAAEPATSAGDSTGAPAQQASQDSERPLVMQIIIDRSLTKAPEWSRGALIAQGAHAAIAIMTETAGEAATQAYVAPAQLGSMHKVVLQSPKTGTLAELSKKLDEAYKAASGDGATHEVLGMSFPRHHLWVEQPEGIPTAIAIAPNRKPLALTDILKKCTLFRD
ncbi:hypothetical protein OC835_001676 [Tilletia horrida]|nr:hypothetical protein OC835_001676 [Tilletia horrida]